MIGGYLEMVGNKVRIALEIFCGLLMGCEARAVGFGLGGLGD